MLKTRGVTPHLAPQKLRIVQTIMALISIKCDQFPSRVRVSVGVLGQTWVLDEVGFHQVVEDVILSDPLHGAAAGGTEGGALHPAGVAGGAEGVHARLQAERTRARPISVAPRRRARQRG